MKKNKFFKEIVKVLIVILICVSIFLPIRLSNVIPQNLKSTTQDKIHFLNVGSGDCILLESNGMLAIIDAGEDATGIRFWFSDREGYEDFVIRYIKENFTQKSGKVDVEFILGTHAHSDHLGNIDSIIKDENIDVKRLYLKKFYNDNIRSKEKIWGMQEQYNNTVAAMYFENSKFQENSLNFLPTDDAFKFGDFTVQFLNTKTYTGKEIIGENENSVITVLEIRGTRICLTGDLNNFKKFDGQGKEDIYGPQIGDVDILKLGHHGYSGSNSREFLQILNPETAIVTNKKSKICKDTEKDLKELSIPVYSSCIDDGVLIEFLEDYYTIKQIKQ